MPNKKTVKIAKNADVEKYLTDMKELSVTDNNETLPEEISAAKAPEKNNMNHDTAKKEVQTEEKLNLQNELAKESVTEINIKHYSPSDIVLAVVNLIALIILFVVLLKIPAKVSEYKKLNSDLQKLSENPEISEVQISQSKEKYDKLTKSFLANTEIVSFVNDVEALKTEGSTISKVTFTNEVPVQDKTGNYGYPVIIELNGDWEKISLDLAKIDSLPYLFRVVKFDSERNEEDGMIFLKYGGILYVNDVRKN